MLLNAATLGMLAAEPRCERCARPASTCICDRLPAAKLASPLEIVILQHPQEDDVLGRVHRADDLHPRERQEAELGGQSHRELDADGGHRMPGAEVVGAEPVVPDDPYALAHVTLPTAHARGRVPP